ncbi:MAG: DUF1353 domain-containing protein [Actinomycetota bacterium]
MPFVGSSDVAVKQIGDDNWELLAPLTYKGNTDTFRMPKGMQTDFASVPRMFVWFIPRYGKYTKAAILHDYLWRHKATRGEIRWADADGIFRRVMRELDVAFLRRWLMWSAVRLASVFKPGPSDGRFEEVWRALLFALVGLVVVLPPALVILVSLGVFFLMELIVLAWIRLSEPVFEVVTGRPRRKETNAPSLRMKM